ncbi:sulfur carrier protein ThiS [Pistricoccus aurantiacus]|uniref:Sulfur carrier protein ThiS n=1 Tax=Pistricoccus aurantiacus TaxID=1883414 RepID=A0A5B8SUR3_9GAMM|nr:sulfur carrier protein ThiS [Pistricoccus aurantiacus]QEA38480.1 sulfur carrier protein ThiS [Pistricoccus aurantiacus]
MQIQLNGDVHRLEGEPTLSQLVASLGLAERRIAIEVNEEIVPRSRHDETRLENGDRVEIVHAIGGG